MTDLLIYNLQDSMCPLMEQLTLFHDHAMFFIIMIISIVGYLLFNIIVNKVTNLFLLSSEFIEIIWTILPGMVLVFIALPSLKVLYLSDDIQNSSLTIKVIGHQWYWSYEYSDFEGLEFDSYMKYDSSHDFRCLDVDNRVVIPTLMNVRVLVTSSDVIHSWAIPSLGVKIDANPGRLNQCLLFSDYNGLFFGQCSEICGVLHSFMPICVEASSLSEFINWIINKN